MSEPAGEASEEVEMVAQERAALALWLLLQAPHSTQALAERLGITRQGADRLLRTISRRVPVYFHKGLWKVEEQSN